jgi:hypothetical protein
MHKTIVGAMVLAAFVLARDAGADPKKAKALNVKGMKKYKKKDYWAAKELFAQAVAEDPAYVTAHYNLASMAGLIGELELATKELEWLKASTDPEAAKKLAKAKKDPDLYPLTTAPSIRALLGLPALDTLPVADALLENGGVWGSNGSWCGGEGTTLTFKKGGKLAIQQEWGCNEDHDAPKETGTWKIVDGALVVASKKMLAGAKPAAWQPCTGDEKLLCLVIEAENLQLELHHGPHQMN